MPSAALESGSTCHLLLDVWLSGLGDSQASEMFLWHLWRRGQVPTVRSGLLRVRGYRDLPWGGAGVQALGGGAKDPLAHQERQDQPQSLRPNIFHMDGNRCLVYNIPLSG